MRVGRAVGSDGEVLRVLSECDPKTLDDHAEVRSTLVDIGLVECLDLRSENGHLRERSVFWAISVPGLSAWCVNGGLPDASTFQQSVQPHKFPVPNASHVGAQLKVDNLKWLLACFLIYCMSL